MSPSYIKGFFLRSGYQGYFGELQNTLEAEQKYVGGLIQVVSLDGVVDVICNDEGKLRGLPVNCAFVDADDNVLDVFVGDLVCVRHDEGEFTDIHEEDLQIIRKYLRPCVILGERAGCTVVRLIPEEELEIWSNEN